MKYANQTSSQFLSTSPTYYSMHHSTLTVSSSPHIIRYILEQTLPSYIMELTDFIPHSLGSLLHHFAIFVWHESDSNTPMGPGMQHKNRAYLFQLHQESDIVSLLGCQFAIRCDYTKALGGFARTLLWFCCVPFSHTIRAVIRNNFPVSEKEKTNLREMLTESITGLTGNKEAFLRFL